MNTKITFTKFIAVAIVSVGLSTQAFAQPHLYGLASEGGTNNAGTIFSFTPGDSLTVICNLDPIYAADPLGGLLYASDGNFYASSVYGGFADSCTIFCSSLSGNLRTVINLDTVSWGLSTPYGNSLIQAMDGNLYGMLTTSGVIFKLELSGRYSAIYRFTGSDGGVPYGSLIQTPDSNFWGMTGYGGTFGRGTIFRCSPSGNLTSVFSFDSSDGIEPFGDLLFANDGNFYGLTSAGGIYGHGTLFRFSPSGTFTKLVDFNDSIGEKPLGSLIQASDNNLYGLTSAYGIAENGAIGVGTLFQCSLSGVLTKLFQFSDTNGSSPEGALMQASDGNFYGMTVIGGQNNEGTIFQYSQTNGFIKLYDLNSVTGEQPRIEKLIEVDNISTGLSKLNNVSASLLFPNPNKGQFSIQIPLSGAKKILEVYNELGNKVFSETITAYQNIMEVNTGIGSSGVYLYRVIDENGSLISKGNFVIQK